MGDSPFDAIRRVRDDGSEYWSARDLMPLLGYDRYENFAQSINRARFAAINSEGETAASEHFRDARKMVPLGNGAQRDIGDRHLTRHACYLVAMNGDPRKQEIADAQAYFAIATRQAETAPRVPDISTPTGVLAMAEQFAATARQLVAAEAKLIEQAPMVAAEEHHRNARGLKAVGDFANDLKAWAKTNHPTVRVRHQDVWDHLARLDMVIRGNTVRHNQPTARAVENEWCVPKVSDFDTSAGAQSSTTTRLTPKGEGYAWDRITAYVEANGTLELPRRIGEAS
jgi:DNA-damage-inducible protein D